MRHQNPEPSRCTFFSFYICSYQSRTWRTRTPGCSESSRAQICLITGFTPCRAAWKTSACRRGCASSLENVDCFQVLNCWLSGFWAEEGLRSQSQGWTRPAWALILWDNTGNNVLITRSVKQKNIYLLFYTPPFASRQLCSLLAISQPASRRAKWDAFPTFEVPYMLMISGLQLGGCQKSLHF